MSGQRGRLDAALARVIGGAGHAGGGSAWATGGTGRAAVGSALRAAAGQPPSGGAGVQDRSTASWFGPLDARLVALRRTTARPSRNARAACSRWSARSVVACAFQSSGQLHGSVGEVSGDVMPPVSRTRRHRADGGGPVHAMRGRPIPDGRAGPA